MAGQVLGTLSLLRQGCTPSGREWGVRRCWQLIGKMNTPYTAYVGGAFSVLFVLCAGDKIVQ